MMPKWTKSPPQLIERFRSFVPQASAVQARQLFGYPCAFVAGNLFMGLHQEDMFLRLSQADQEQLLSVEGSHEFAPMPGRPMKGYVVVAPSVVESDADLELWVRKALEHTSALPAKEAKKAKLPAKKPRAK